jgi:hypothetical protein
MEHGGRGGFWEERDERSEGERRRRKKKGSKDKNISSKDTADNTIYYF